MIILTIIAVSILIFLYGEHDTNIKHNSFQKSLYYIGTGLLRLILIFIIPGIPFIPVYICIYFKLDTLSIFFTIIGGIIFSVMAYKIGKAKSMWK